MKYFNKSYQLVFFMFGFIAIGCNEPTPKKVNPTQAAKKRLVKSCCNSNLPSRFGVTAVKPDTILSKVKIDQ